MKKQTKIILLSAVAIFIFWYFGRDLNWQQVVHNFAGARPEYIVLAILFICIGLVLRAKRWQVILRPITESSFRELFATTTLGFAAIFLVGRMGELVRPMWLPMRDKRVRPSAAVVTIILERIFDLAALIGFFALNLLWFNIPVGRETEFVSVQIIGYLLVAGLVLGFLGLYLFHKKSRRALPFLDRLIDFGFIPERVKGIVSSILQRLAKSLNILEDRREILSVTFWTILLWFTIAIPTWLVLLAFNLELGFSDALFVLGWAAVGSLVPTPGGSAGAFHAATAGGLLFLNISRESAVAAAFALHLVYFAPSLIFAIYYIVSGDFSFSRFKELLTQDADEPPIEAEKMKP